jgi:predicted dehydrogenase
MKTYRVAVVSLVHDHIWGELAHWKARPNAELVAVSDAHPHLLEKAQTGYGIPKGYASWRELLDAEGDSLDVVQVGSENNVHADVVEACAARGIHVAVEKPMAATLAQAERMMRASEAAGTRLLVNWPTAWGAAWQEMERLILAGEIGTLRYFKYRSAHNGPKEIGCSPEFWGWLYDAEKNGAGALMDYCCYGAAMAARFLGLPARVTGLRGVLAKDYPLPDDNAIITLQYAHAMAVCEASWTQTTGYITPNPVAYGSDGAIAITDGKVHLQKAGVRELRIITPPAPKAPRRNAAEYFLHGLETGEPFEGVCAPEVSRLGQESLEAGIRSSDTNTVQTLPLVD